MVERLASITGGLRDHVFAVRQTALWPEDVPSPYFRRMLFRVGDGWVDTPAGSLATAPAGYVTFAEAYFDDVQVYGDAPVKAVLDAKGVRQMAACIDRDEQTRIDLFGDPDCGCATELRVSAGETTIRFDELPDESFLSDVPEQMPETFDDGRFCLADGSPAPTVVETTAASLSRIVDAVEAVDGATYPLSVTEVGPELDVSRRGVSACARLPGRRVEGPSVQNRYGDAFARAVRTLEGGLRLETAPDGPLAIVSENDEYTARIVVPAR